MKLRHSEKLNEGYLRCNDEVTRLL